MFSNDADSPGRQQECTLRRGSDQNPLEECSRIPEPQKLWDNTVLYTSSYFSICFEHGQGRKGLYPQQGHQHFHQNSSN